MAWNPNAKTVLVCRVFVFVCSIQRGGAFGSIKKPKNRSKNYPKPKNPIDFDLKTENRIPDHQDTFSQNPSLDLKRR